MYAEIIRFCIKRTNVKTPKIDWSTLWTYGIIPAIFSLKDKLKQVWFSKETFLIADISMKIILEMLFFSFSNIDV